MATFGSVTSNTSILRQFIITANQFRKGGTAPTDATIGTTPTVSALLFNATNELASTYIILPLEMDKTVNFSLVLTCSLSATETNDDTLDITCDYTASIRNTTGSGVAKTSTQITSSTVVTTGNGLAIGDIYEATLAFPAADATNPTASANAIAIEIHLTNTDEVGEIHLLGACLNYTAKY